MYMCMYSDCERDCILKGLENPCYDSGERSDGRPGASNLVQMSELGSGDSVKPATMKKKRSIKKKKSTGFENPVYFDNKVSDNRYIIYILYTCLIDW